MGAHKTFWMHHIRMISPINLCEWTNWIQEKCIYLTIIVGIIILSTAGLRLFIVWTDLFFLLQGCQMLCLLGFAEAPPPNSHTQTQMQWEGLFVGHWLQSKGKQIYKRHWFTSAKKKKLYIEKETPRLLDLKPTQPRAQKINKLILTFDSSRLLH